MAPHYSFRIFVAGKTLQSERTVDGFRNLCERTLQRSYSLEVVDVNERPWDAEHSHIIATPTVVRLSPRLDRRMIGGLWNPALASIALGLVAR